MDTSGLHQLSPDLTVLHQASLKKFCNVIEEPPLAH